MTQRCIAGGIWSKTISPKSRSSAPSPRDTTRQSKASAPTSTLPLRSSPQGKCQQTLEAQRGYLAELETTVVETLEGMAREAMAIGNRRFDIRLQVLLGAIATLQVAGTFSSLVAIWPTAGLWACLRHGTCGYDSSGSQPLLMVVALTILLGLVVGLYVTTSVLRQRNSLWHVPNGTERQTSRSARD